MNTEFIKGVIVPILTIIDGEERIDEAAMRRHVDFVIEGGVLGILAFGSNGEFYMVEDGEMERGLNIIVDQTNGRVPVYFGIGAISTKKCVRLAQMAVRCRADGISVLQPMFLKPTEEELFLHFKTIGESVPDTPMLLYNNPGGGLHPVGKSGTAPGRGSAEYRGYEGHQRRHHPDGGIYPQDPAHGI